MAQFQTTDRTEARALRDRETRQRDIRRIHAMRRELALTEDSYRAMVKAVSEDRTDSSADLTEAERAALIRRFKALGAGRARKQRSGSADQTAVKQPFKESPHLKKCRAMWIELAKAGVVHDRRDTALAAFIRRQTGVDIGALKPAQWSQVIEALKDMAARHEMLSEHGDVLAAMRVARGPEAEAQRARIRALWQALHAAGEVANWRDAALDRWMDRITGRCAGLDLAAPGELDQAERDLGAWLDRARR